MTDEQTHDLIVAIEASTHAIVLSQLALATARSDPRTSVEAEDALNASLESLLHLHVKWDGRLMANDAERVANEGRADG